MTLRNIVREHMTTSDLGAIVSDLSAAEWRALLLAAADHRCIACGESDGCDCDDLTDAAKERVTRRAAGL